MKSCAVFLNHCILQFDDMTSNDAKDLWKLLETTPETASDEVFATQFPAKLSPPPLHPTLHPPTSPHTSNKSVPQPPISVPSHTRPFLPDLNPASDFFEYFFLII